jgi:acyl carrier protein
MTEDEILAKLREILSEAFEIEPSRVIPPAKLYDELGLDSIDAVDLAIKLQEMTGKRIKPENFKGVRTVGDVIGVVQSLLAA